MASAAGSLGARKRERKESERVPAAAETLADALVSALYEAGIDTYFGVPGGAIEPLFNALARARDRGQARVIATRSEAGAGFAADGYFRACGRMAVCTGTTGPGISNLLTAVINAHADRVPLVVLSPQVALPKHGRGACQDSSHDGYDVVRLLEPATVYSSLVTHPEQLPHKLLQALSRALTEPRGPVHLSIPSDILAGALPNVSLRLPSAQWPPQQRSAIPGDTLNALWLALEAAERPVFYVGDDAGPESQRVFELAAHFACSVITSPAGKRWVSHYAPRYAGVLGFSGHATALEALRAADLVVALGVTFDELSTNAWAALPEAPTFVIDSHARFAYRVPHAQPILVEPGVALTWLAAKLPAPAAHASPVPLRQARVGLAGTEHGPVHPSDLMHWLSATLPDFVVVHVDTGNGFSWSTRDLLRASADTYRVAMGLSTMCWAIGAALGAAVASGERTLCIVGDGALLMSSLELCVAVQEQLPVTYVVLNDAGFGMVKHGQRLANAPSIAHQIGEVRFDMIAQGVGSDAFRVTSYAELETIPRCYFESSEHGPCLIDVVIDGEAVPPMMDRVVGLASGIPK